MNQKLLILFCAFFSSMSLSAQTNIPALITSDQVWTVSGSPYNLTQNCYIDTNVIVKVMPGVEINGSAGLRILIDGEFQILGNSDSLVICDQLQVEYQSAAKPYNPIHKRGAYIKYAKFTGNGSTSVTSIRTRQVSIFVEYCTFINAFYGISGTSSSNSTFTSVYNCSFLDSTGYSYPINMGSNGVIDVQDCYFNGGSSIYAYGDINFERNYVDNFDRVYINSYEGCNVACNTFKNIQNSLEFKIYTRDTSPVNSFTNNTLDSIGRSSIYPMFKLWYLNSIYNLGQFNVNGNNFLHNNGSLAKAEIYGSNPSPTTSTSLNFTGNYWGSNDSATIASYIEDYADDVTIFGEVDFSNYLTSENTTCPQSSSCEALFYVAVDTTNTYNLYVINNSTGTTSTTSYYWTFGDGSSSTDSTPSHYYSSFGKYELCLTLTDSANNCISTYCDSIGLDSNGNLLKQDGFNLQVFTEIELMGLEDMKTISSLNVYPNPSTGIIQLEYFLNTSENTSIHVFNSMGQLVNKQNHIGMVGENNIQFDFRHLPKGLYIIQVKSGNESTSKRIVIH
ncbi:MAG: T9SS type A sorting domain-containing protein [Bacteroidia bacterium]